MKTVELKDIAEGKKFRFPRPTMLTGVYFRTGPVYPQHMDYYYVHEVGVPLDEFISGEHTEVIPEEDENNITV